MPRSRRAHLRWDLTTGQSFSAQPFPDFIKDIIAKGGLMNSIKG